MRESALFGTMFSLGAGAVLAGVTVSRLVVGQAPEKSVEEPTAVAVETARPAAVEPPPPPAAVIAPPAVAPRAEIALSGQHRPLPRKHRRATVAEKSAPPTAPVVKETAPTSPLAKREAPRPAPPAPAAEETAPTASIAKREAPTPAPPAPVVEETAPPASIAKRETPTPAPPPRPQVDDPPLARDAPIAIVRGGVARMESPAPGAHIIQVEPRDR